MDYNGPRGLWDQLGPHGSRVVLRSEDQYRDHNGPRGPRDRPGPRGSRAVQRRDPLVGFSAASLHGAVLNTMGRERP